MNFEKQAADIHAKTKRQILPIIFLVFFLSGSCALIYEVVWLKTLSLVFGVTTLATATTLASFMAGMGLGSYFFGNIAAKIRRPLRLYGVLELGIAIFAFIMPLIFAGLDNVYVFFYRHITTGYFWFGLVRLVLSFASLLVPTFLMGGTLPIISRFLIRRQGELGKRISQLYFINTLGAAAGTALTGFVLIYFLGVKESAYLAGALGCVVALIAFMMDRQQETTMPEQNASHATVTDTEVALLPLSPTANINDETPAPYSLQQTRLAVWAIGISGFCSLSLEVLWTRALVYILDNTAQAFTTMLTAFLLGIAIGSLLISRWLDRGRRLLLGFGILEISIGLLALLSIPLFANIGAGIGAGADVYPTDNQALWVLIRFARSLAVMLLPAILMGMTIPLAVRLYTRSEGTVGTAVGRVYGVNTWGGVIGSFVAGLVLLPLLGIYGSVMLVAALEALVGLILICCENYNSYVNKVKTAAATATPFIVAVALLFSHNGAVFSSTVERTLPHHILYYREGAAGTVKVYQDVFTARTISIDGFPVAGTITRHIDAQKSLGHLPLLLSTVDHPNIAIIGFGAGGSTWAATLYDPGRLDVVELVPDVLQAARLIGEVNHGVMDDPMVNIIHGDGRNYMLLTNQVYDVISVDATSPKSAGSGSLYSVEFYQACQERLSENGLLVAWLPYHLMSETDVKMVARTFQEVFPHATLWYSFTRHYYLLIGTQQPLAVDLERLQGLTSQTEIKQELLPMGINDAYDVMACLLLSEGGLRDYAGGGLLNTDNHPLLEYGPATAYLNVGDYARENLNATRYLRESAWHYLYNLKGITEMAVKEILDGRIAATPIERYWPLYIE